MIIQQSAGPMTESLHAPGPDAEHQAKLMQFGCLVGSWDLDVVYYDESGAIKRRTPGEWHFGWVLEGRAIVDVWDGPAALSACVRGPSSRRVRHDREVL